MLEVHPAYVLGICNWVNIMYIFHSIPETFIVSFQCAPFYQVSQSECPLTLGVPINVPPSAFSISVHPYIRCPHESAPLHQISLLECPLTRFLHQSGPKPFRNRQAESSIQESEQAADRNEES